MSGKGGRQRPTDLEAYRRGWERVFQMRPDHAAHFVLADTLGNHDPIEQLGRQSTTTAEQRGEPSK